MKHHCFKVYLFCILCATIEVLIMIDRPNSNNVNPNHSFPKILSTKKVKPNPKQRSDIINPNSNIAFMYQLYLTIKYIRKNESRTIIIGIIPMVYISKAIKVIKKSFFLNTLEDILPS